MSLIWFFLLYKSFLLISHATIWAWFKAYQIIANLLTKQYLFYYFANCIVIIITKISIIISVILLL